MTESSCKQFTLRKIKGSSLQFPENFYVVQFHDGLALVPNNWLQESVTTQQVICYYPKYEIKKKLYKAIQSKEIPEIKNIKAGWAMYDVLRIFASADSFERGLEKLRMAENLSDINTEDEECIKQTRKERATAKNFTSDEDSSEAEMDFLSPVPDPKEFCKSPLLHPKKNKMVQIEKKNQSQQELEPLDATYNKKKIENKNQDLNIKDNVYSIDEELINNDQCQKVLKEILKKVNRILVEVTYIDRRLTRLENKISDKLIQNPELNINEDFGTFNTISSINELHQFENNLNNDEFFVRMRDYLKLKGGTNLQDVIKNTFRALITDDLLTTFSWKGVRTKNHFCHFKIVNLVIAVVRLQNNNATEDIIKKYMSNWIVQAPARVRRIADKEKNQEYVSKTDQHEIVDEENHF